MAKTAVDVPCETFRPLLVVKRPAGIRLYVCQNWQLKQQYLVAYSTAAGDAVCALPVFGVVPFIQSLAG